MPMPEPAPPRPLAPSRSTLPDPPARSPLAEDGTDRLRRGRLVHRLLQTLPEVPPAARAAAGRRYLRFSVHGLTVAEQESILAETLAVLDRPDFAAVFGPQSRAEVPIVAVTDAHAVSGQIDRIVVLKDRLLIVDYKTLRPAPAHPGSVPPAYLRQLAVYCRALAAVYPGHAIDAAILWTDGPILMPIPSALLEVSRVAGASLHGAGAGAIA
jgi:ATP-dependent helicase/nuclease subunit A